MTRHMPGPPKYDPTAWPHVTGTDLTLIHLTPPTPPDMLTP